MNSLYELSPLAEKVWEWALNWLPAQKDYPKNYQQDFRAEKALSKYSRKPEQDIPPLVDEAVAALKEVFGNETATAVTAFYCLPAARKLPHRGQQNPLPTWRIHKDMLTIAEYFLVRESTPHTRQLLLTRLQGLLTRELPPESTTALDFTVENLGENYRHFYDTDAEEEGYLKPVISDLAAILIYCLNPEEHWEECRALLHCEWNREFIPHYSNNHRENTYAIIKSHLRLRWLIEKCLAVAFERGEFDYTDFCRMADLSHGLVHYTCARYDREDEDERENQTHARAILCEYNERYVWERYEIIEPIVDPEEEYRKQVDRFGTLETCAGDRYPGCRWLLKTCEHIETYGLTAKVVCDEYGHLPSIFTGFAAVHRYADGETPETLAESLKAFKPATLWLVFPFAGLGQRPILTALKAEALIPLHEFMMQLVGGQPYRPKPRINTFDNSDSEESGIVDFAALETAVEKVPAKLIKKYFTSLKKSKAGYTRAVYLCEAVMGTNRATLEKSLAKHNQIGLKAYGLLPLQDENDPVERYLTLRRVWKECTKYGAERQANTRAAITVGLKNLARRAGYRDVARLEWDMESRLSEQVESVLDEQVMGDWTVSVEMEGLKTKLRVQKAGKLLKSVPAGLRKHPDYKGLREQMKMLDDQARRFRLALENMMCNGETLNPDELKKLGRIAAVRFLMSNLIGIDANGHTGLIDAGQAKLAGLADTQPVQGDLRIAHVDDLYQSQILSQWQKKLVGAGLVQPFKQAFRELYVVTPAEEDTSPQSHRYEGRNINTAIAYRLLQSRGWYSRGGEGDCDCIRIFPDEDITAYWLFPGVHHFFTEDETQVADVIEFRRGGKLIPLHEVPRRIFSEVMRDADLAVSVAAVEDDGGYWSAEVGAARIAVVQEVMNRLGFDNLTFEDHFVYVQGKRARYRIHMGSGNIHIMPGAYLCIVPERKGKEKPIYLPFAESDRKTTEIISKAILLSDDDRIDDASINTQINAAVGA